MECRLERGFNAVFGHVFKTLKLLHGRARHGKCLRQRQRHVTHQSSHKEERAYGISQKCRNRSDTHDATKRYYFSSLQTTVDGFQNESCLCHCRLELQRQILIIKFIFPPLLERFTVYVMRRLSLLRFKLINTKIPPFNLVMYPTISHISTIIVK
jgi:hypothetical protein